MALKPDGTLVKWGDFGNTNVPPNVTNVVAIAGGSSHILALKTDGTVVAWGDNSEGQCNVPAGLLGVEAIAAGGQASYALKTDGSVVVWGAVDLGSPLSEMRNIKAVSGYVDASDGFFSHGLALRYDGTIVAWGDNNYGETNVPPGLSNVVAIAGNSSPLALKADGTVVAWGYNGQGQTNIPPGLSNVVAIASGSGHQLALKADGSVVAWGYNYYGQTNVPVSLSNVVAVSAGSYRSLALIGDGSPFITIAPRSHSVLSGTTSSLFVAAAGEGPLQYQWKFNGTNLPTGTNAMLVLSAVQFNQSGIYSVVVSNVLGTATHELVLNVVPALITTQSPGQITFRGATVTFEVTVEGQSPLNYQWKFSGSDLPGQTNSTLVITNVQFQQAGAYSVVVGSGLGSVTGTDINLSVGRIAAWGESRHGQLRLPEALTNVLAIAGGYGHSLALKNDGSVVSWGYNYYGQADVPPGLSNVLAIAAGDYHSMALKSDGTVVVWGNNSYGQTDVPPGLSNVVAIATSPYVNFALKADGTVEVWGVDFSSLGNLPSDLTNVVTIGAGYYQGAALKASGDIVVWGANNTVPTNMGYVQAISVSKYNHGIALKADGTVAVWNSLPDAPATLSNVVAIASGNAHALALSAAGSVVAWGDNSVGQTNVPAGLANVTAIAGGTVHSLALVGDNPPVTQTAAFNSRRSVNALRLALPSQSGRVYRAEYRSSLVDSNWTALPLATGNGGVLVITDSTATNAQRFYRVRQW
jgi:alpha-tubulin suppressor-like RCC1 family protein